MHQQSLAESELETHFKMTRREQFLTEMDRLIP